MNERDFNRWFDGSLAKGKRWCICPECSMMHMAYSKKVTECPECGERFIAKPTRKKPIIVLDERYTT